MPKKQLIMEKALELFAKQGFEATSIQQITEHSGISKGAFYLSFKSKEELILALTEYFMSQFISDIDHVVKEAKIEDLLFTFYHAIFHSFYKHSDFAKIFVKEQTQTFNQAFIVKMHEYDRLLDKIILSMIERIYGKDVTYTKYDLVYCMKGFIGNYSKLLLFNTAPLDLNLLAKSLVEKTDLLAQHTTISFITKELIEVTSLPIHEEITKEKVFELIEQKIVEMEDSIEKESLILLKSQIFELTYSPAIIKGLLENVRKNSHCKWISYLLKNHFKF